MHTNISADPIGSESVDQLARQENLARYRVLYVAPVAVRRTTNRKEVATGLTREQAITRADELNAAVPNRGHFGCGYYETAREKKSRSLILTPKNRLV